MSWTHIEDTTPTARKPYKCYLCGLPIAKGEKHVKRYGIIEGEGRVSTRMHIACEALTRHWEDVDWEVAHDPAEFREYCLPRTDEETP
jgi:hypothetical protein